MYSYLWDGGGVAFTAYEIMNIIFIISILGMYMTLIIKTKLYQKKLQCIIFVIANLLFIPTAYIWDFVSSEGIGYRLMMLYCVGLLYLMGVALADKLMSIRFGNCYIVLMAAIIFNFGLIDNIGYYNLNLCWEQTYATAIQMQDRLQQLEGYEDTNDILIVGTLALKNDNKREWVTDRIPEMIGVADVNLMRNQDLIIPILNTDLGMTVERISEEQKQELELSEEVKNMGN